MESSMHNFAQNKQNAIEQMREMNRRATINDSVSRETDLKTPSQNSISSINIPSDAILILGLILILSKEKCDKLLVLALLYILA